MTTSVSDRATAPANIATHATHPIQRAAALPGGLADWQPRPFVPARVLANAHAMTILGSKRPRKFALTQAPCEQRRFQTEPHTQVVTFCHWQRQRTQHPTLLVIHGLEGSAAAHYVMGTADKAWRAGFNVIRQNVRNCGGTTHLTPTLYHSGLTTDLHAITHELIERDGLPELFVTGFSMGGNQTLKFAGELGAAAPAQLKAIVAISPPIDLGACSRAIQRRENWLYEKRFLLSLARTMKTKAAHFPQLFDLTRFERIQHLWDWDEAYQHHNGFAGAADYYRRASSLGYLERIQVPALLITAQDDPFIPFVSFGDARLRHNPALHLLAPTHGGHVAFCGQAQPDEDRGWAEARAVEFCRLYSDLQ